MNDVPPFDPMTDEEPRTVLTPSQVTAVSELMAQVAEVEVRPRFRALKDTEIFQKGKNDPVTVADHASEAALAKGLREILPEAAMLGEEMAHEDKGLLGLLKEDAPVWVIDPIDGTRSFVKGRDRYCMIVALVERGQTLGGWVYRPETGDLYTAVRGQGAFHNGHLITPAPDAQTRPETPFEIAMDGRAFSKDVQSLVAETLDRKPDAVQRTDLYSAGLVYAHVATGQHDGVLFRSWKPWDHAAGCLIVKEAGGRSITLDGDPYDPRAQKPGILSLRAAGPEAAIAEIIRSHLEALRAAEKKTGGR